MVKQGDLVKYQGSVSQYQNKWFIVIGVNEENKLFLVDQDQQTLMHVNQESVTVIGTVDMKALGQ